jgi:uncharacterized protein
MRLNPDLSPDAVTIRGYARGEVLIGQTLYREPVLLTPTQVAPLAAVARAAELTQTHVEQLLAAEPQIVLVGTPHADDWPSAAWRAQFLSRGVGVEVMNTGAACRTYTVLASELRRVAAVLLP